jgi:hypothetical protein
MRSVERHARPYCIVLRGNDAQQQALFLQRLNPTEELARTLLVDRALSIYGALADRSELKGAREHLSKHRR